jgi:TonB family protein
MKFATPYGAFELKRVYQRNLSSALALATFIHILLIGSLMIFSYNSVEIAREKREIIITPNNPLPPPSLNRFQAKQVLLRELSVTKPPSKGIPQAVSDEQVDETQLFVSQADLQKALVNPLLDQDKDEYESLIVQFQRKEYLPPPEKFIPTDELPEPVRMVTPDYPQLAKIAGVEGVIWIQAFVAKDGKVKEARCVKEMSVNPEIFCESAIQAAMQNEYKPALSNKEPVGIWVTYKVEFKLK